MPTTAPMHPTKKWQPAHGRPGIGKLRSQLLFLAWRNIWRNRLRTVLTLSAMGVGLVMMILVSALNEGVMRKFMGYATDLQLGHLQMHRQLYLDDQDLYALIPWELIAHLRQRTGLAIAPRVYAAGLAGSGELATGVILKGIDPELEAGVTRLPGHVKTGVFRLDLWRRERDAPGGEDYLPPIHNVVIGNRLAKTLRVGLGGELVLITQAGDGSIGNGLFRVAGVLKPVEPGFDRTGVLLSLPAWQSLMALDQGAHELAVALPDARKTHEAQTALAAAVNSWPGSLDQDDGGPVRVRRWDQINKALAQILALSNVSMSILMGIIFGVAALGMLNTVLMAVHERRREFGMLLAMGMSRGSVLAMVLLESFLLALLAILAGSLVGTGAALWLQTVGIDFSALLPDGLEWAGITIEARYQAHLLPGHVLVSAAVMVVIIMAAAAIPALRTVRFRPAEAMHL
ncbi:MAG: FtsX-like permease family protein [bacterium]